MAILPKLFETDPMARLPLLSLLVLYRIRFVLKIRAVLNEQAKNTKLVLNKLMACSDIMTKKGVFIMIVRVVASREVICITQVKVSIVQVQIIIEITME